MQITIERVGNLKLNVRKNRGEKFFIYFLLV